MMKQDEQSVEEDELDKKASIKFGNIRSNIKMKRKKMKQIPLEIVPENNEVSYESGRSSNDQSVIMDIYGGTDRPIINKEPKTMTEIVVQEFHASDILIQQQDSKLDFTISKNNDLLEKLKNLASEMKNDENV